MQTWCPTREDQVPGTPLPPYAQEGKTTQRRAQKGLWAAALPAASLLSPNQPGGDREGLPSGRHLAGDAANPVVRPRGACSDPSQCEGWGSVGPPGHSFCPCTALRVGAASSASARVPLLTAAAPQNKPAPSST